MAERTGFTWFLENIREIQEKIGGWAFGVTDSGECVNGTSVSLYICILTCGGRRTPKRLIIGAAWAPHLTCISLPSRIKRVKV